MTSTSSVIGEKQETVQKQKEKDELVKLESGSTLTGALSKRNSSLWGCILYSNVSVVRFVKKKGAKSNSNKKSCRIITVEGSNTGFG